jgi:ssRNA-specific RNase YbeY (16S rRNA maturation enzyme)
MATTVLSRLRPSLSRGVPSTPSLAALLTAIKSEAGYADWCVGLRLTSRSTIARLNRTYRGRAGATDILSFARHDLRGEGRAAEAFPAEARADSSQRDLGDLVVCPDYILQGLRRDLAGEEAGRAAAAAAPSGARREGGGEGMARRGGRSSPRPVPFPAPVPRAHLIDAYATILTHGVVHLLGYDHEEDYGNRGPSAGPGGAGGGQPLVAVLGGGRGPPTSVEAAAMRRREREVLALVRERHGPALEALLFDEVEPVV